MLDMLERYQYDIELHRSTIRDHAGQGVPMALPEKGCVTVPEHSVVRICFGK